MLFSWSPVPLSQLFYYSSPHIAQYNNHQSLSTNRVTIYHYFFLSSVGCFMGNWVSGDIRLSLHVIMLGWVSYKSILIFSYIFRLFRRNFMVHWICYQYGRWNSITVLYFHVFAGGAEQPVFILFSGLLWPSHSFFHSFFAILTVTKI